MGKVLIDTIEEMRTNDLKKRTQLPDEPKKCARAGCVFFFIFWTQKGYIM